MCVERAAMLTKRESSEEEEGAASQTVFWCDLPGADRAPSDP
jgi:hypothetical protein